MEVEVKWIKILTGMFDDEKIKLIEAMPEADMILIIWIKLLTLAGKKNMNGYIFLTENIPYTDEMFTAIFNRPLNTIRLALDTLKKFGMIQCNKNGILQVINWEKHQNIDGLERIKKQNKLRQRKYRGGCDKNVTGTQKKLSKPEADTGSNVTVTLQSRKVTPLEEEKEEDIEKEKKGKGPNKKLSPSFNFFIDKWNEKLEPKIRQLSDSRKKQLRVRLKEEMFVDNYEKILGLIKTTSFLQGSNDRGWTADFGWLIANDTNYLKVLEGNYKNKSKGGLL